MDHQSASSSSSSASSSTITTKMESKPIVAHKSSITDVADPYEMYSAIPSFSIFFDPDEGIAWGRLTFAEIDRFHTVKGPQAPKPLSIVPIESAEEESNETKVPDGDDDVDNNVSRKLFPDPSGVTGVESSTPVASSVSRAKRRIPSYVASNRKSIVANRNSIASNRNSIAPNRKSILPNRYLDVTNQKPNRKSMINCYQRRIYHTVCTPAWNIKPDAASTPLHSS